MFSIFIYTLDLYKSFLLVERKVVLILKNYANTVSDYKILTALGGAEKW